MEILCHCLCRSLFHLLTEGFEFSNKGVVSGPQDADLVF